MYAAGATRTVRDRGTVPLRALVKQPERYLEWTRPWSPGPPPERLSGRGLRTLQEAGLASGALPPGEADPVLAERRRRWLEKRIVRDAPEVRQLASREEALRHFGQGARGRADVNDALLIRTFVWQFVTRVLAGQERPIRGNLRSVWYRELRLVLLRLGLIHPDDEPRDPEASPFAIPVAGALAPRPRGTDRGKYLLDLLEQGFQEMFLAGFFRYADLEVYDARENFWSLGRSRGNILFFTEKEGLFWLCRRIQALFDVTILASRGSPIWITVDYLSRVLRRRGYSSLRVVALSDFDPWGYAMGGQVRSKFADPVNGFRRVTLENLTRLELFTEERLQRAKRYLLAGHEDPGDPVRTLVEEWVQLTGGIGGEPYGIHVDHAEPPLILAAFERWLGTIEKGRRRSGGRGGG